MTRVESLRKALGDLEALVVTSEASIAYLSGFRPLALERLFAVVVRADGRGAVVVPRLDEGQVADTKLDRVAYDADSDGIPELIGALGGVRRVGVEEDHLQLARARALEAAGCELVAAGSLVLERRARKDEGEVERIRAACRLVEQAYPRLWEELRPGVVERVVNARIEAWLREQGATHTHPLVLFGENAANPHAQPGERSLRPGDVVCADLSAQLDGYWADLTRCAFVGPASEWARAAWAVVREAQAAAIEASRPGAPAREVDAAQRRIVEAAAELGACLHGAGHAVGLEVHEPPFLVPRVDEPLAEGMVLTIEPGLYRAGLGGIRLEDDVLVTAGGRELLSHVPLGLVELPATS